MVSEITIKISMAAESGSLKVGQVQPEATVMVEGEVPPPPPYDESITFPEESVPEPPFVEETTVMVEGEVPPPPPYDESITFPEGSVPEPPSVY